MDSLHRLEEIFSQFPGIGPRQARRFAYFVLNKPATFTNDLVELIKQLKKSALECISCHRTFIQEQTKNNHKNNICFICSDNSRDKNILMVVARDSDFETIERSGAYRGLYFIIGGTIPILDKEPEKRIRLQKLLEHVANTNNLKEVILSLNTTPDGEHTADIIKNALQKITTDKSITITTLGRGLSTGAELEYADKETIKNALISRKTN